MTKHSLLTFFVCLLFLSFYSSTVSAQDSTVNETQVPTPLERMLTHLNSYLLITKSCMEPMVDLREDIKKARKAPAFSSEAGWEAYRMRTAKLSTMDIKSSFIKSRAELYSAKAEASKLNDSELMDIFSEAIDEVNSVIESLNALIKPMDKYIDSNTSWEQMAKVEEKYNELGSANKSYLDFLLRFTSKIDTRLKNRYL